MSIKLKFEDFKLDSIEQNHVIGGQGGTTKEYTLSTCTTGDEGCCDESGYDDIQICPTN